MAQAQLHKVEKMMLFLTILFLPLNGLPKAISLPIIGGNASHWFFLLGLLVLIFEFIKYGFEIPILFRRFLLIFTFWQITCLAIGIIFYPYNSYLTIDQSPHLQALLLWMNSYGIYLNELTALKIWLFLRFTKDILLNANLLFYMCFYIYHLYEDNYDECFHDIRHAMLALFLFMGTYSLIELTWLKTGSETAGNILSFINPYLYDVKIINHWWPPLLWNGQLRSLAHEPSFFGILSVFCLPFLWSYLYKSRKKILYGVLIGYFSLMIFATNARTAIALAGVEVILLILSMFWIRKKVYTKTVISIILISACAFSVNLINFPGLLNSDSNDDFYSASSYYRNNIGSLGNKDSRSNNARLANLIANLETIKDYPITGVGIGLKDAYIDDRLPEFSYTNYEVRNWSRDLHREGVLKSAYPPLNKYADVAVQNGIIGLIIFLLPFFYLLKKIHKHLRPYLCNVSILFPIFSLIGLAGAWLSNSEYSECMGIIIGLLFCIDFDKDTMEN